MTECGSAVDAHNVYEHEREQLSAVLGSSSISAEDKQKILDDLGLTKDRAEAVLRAPTSPEALVILYNSIKTVPHMESEGSATMEHELIVARQEALKRWQDGIHGTVRMIRRQPVT